jgi:hypothetical protein
LLSQDADDDGWLIGTRRVDLPHAWFWKSKSTNWIKQQSLSYNPSRSGNEKSERLIFASAAIVFFAFRNDIGQHFESTNRSLLRRQLQGRSELTDL